MGSERGEQPLSRCGERGVQRERGGSRNTPLTLWPSGATPAAMHLAKGIRPALRGHPLRGKRRFRIASASLWQSQRKNYFLFAFVALCGALQTHFHGRGRSGQLHLLLLACGPCAAGIGAFTGSRLALSGADAPALPKGEPLAKSQCLPYCQGLSLWERWTRTT